MTKRFPEIAAVAIGALFLAAGLWAFIAPASFFEEAATFEPYNVHLIRDIGAFQIGLGAVLLLAAATYDALFAALAGVAVGAVVAAHVIDQNRGGDPAVDIPMFGLVALVLIAAAVVRAASALRR